MKSVLRGAWRVLTAVGASVALGVSVWAGSGGIIVQTGGSGGGGSGGGSGGTVTGSYSLAVGEGSGTLSTSGNGTNQTLHISGMTNTTGEITAGQVNANGSALTLSGNGGANQVLFQGSSYDFDGSVAHNVGTGTVGTDVANVGQVQSALNGTNVALVSQIAGATNGASALVLTNNTEWNALMNIGNSNVFGVGAVTYVQNFQSNLFYAIGNIQDVYSNAASGAIGGVPGPFGHLYEFATQNPYWDSFVQIGNGPMENTNQTPNIDGNTNVFGPFSQLGETFVTNLTGTAADIFGLGRAYVTLSYTNAYGGSSFFVLMSPDNCAITNDWTFIGQAQLPTASRGGGSDRAFPWTDPSGNLWAIVSVITNGGYGMLVGELDPTVKFTNFVAGTVTVDFPFSWAAGNGYEVWTSDDGLTNWIEDNGYFTYSTSFPPTNNFSSTNGVVQANQVGVGGQGSLIQSGGKFVFLTPSQPFGDGQIGGYEAFTFTGNVPTNCSGCATLTRGPEGYPLPIISSAQFRRANTTQEVHDVMMGLNRVDTKMKQNQTAILGAMQPGTVVTNGSSPTLASAAISGSTTIGGSMTATNINAATQQGDVLGLVQLSNTLWTNSGTLALLASSAGSGYFLGPIPSSINIFTNTAGNATLTIGGSSFNALSGNLLLMVGNSSTNNVFVKSQNPGIINNSGSIDTLLPGTFNGYYYGAANKTLNAGWKLFSYNPLAPQTQFVATNHYWLINSTNNLPSGMITNSEYFPSGGGSIIDSPGTL
jgi:hypothetical protein